MNHKEVSIPSSIRLYLEEIADRVWSDHAAVLVGAGFSKNANCNAPVPKFFPDWHQLGILFHEKIHGARPDENQHFLNVLKLADEVEAAFGRPVLDQLLRANIPDKDYDPSSLHVKFLELPWVDIFTTNYDTLLERACSSVTSKKYDIVRNKEDLVYSERPRIIKLHGSFPSERPFIITEEDYRKYPSEFAPFVNTVQQALLENTLCLVGFSGDDPNFLHWIGWIRDNLGVKNSPKMFLVGIFDLPEAQIKLLEQRNIVLINLDIISDVCGDHSKALNLFCDYLLSKKEDNSRLGWPDNQELMSPDVHTADPAKRLEKILPEWKRIRKSYPGWLVLPEDRRNPFWLFTHNWINSVHLFKKLPAPLDIELLYEFNWRIELSLFPIPNNLIEEYTKILGKYNPFPLSNNDDEIGVLQQGDAKKEQLPWGEIQEKWIELYLSLLRFYREENFLDGWNDTNEIFEKIYSYLSSRQTARLHYERVMFELFSLDLPNIKKQLISWPINRSLPFWEAKRAGLLAEIGEMEESENILESSLSYIRSKLNLVPVKNNYTLVSQESYVMLLLQYVKGARSFTGREFDNHKAIRRQFTKRWVDLKQYNCDPWSELKSFELALDHDPSYISVISEKYEFDIGKVTRTRNFGSMDKEAISAYSFLRFCEDIGLPFRVPGSTIAKTSVKGVLTRITQYSSPWAFVSLFRGGDIKMVDSIFNRESIYQMDINAVDDMVVKYLQVLEKCQPYIEQGDGWQRDNFGILLAQMIPEILSRMCCKCSRETKGDLLVLLENIYKSEHRFKYKGVGVLVKRLLISYSDQEQYEIIPKLLDFPVLGDVPLPAKEEFPNPFTFVRVDGAPSSDFPMDCCQKIVQKLCVNVGSGNVDERKWAALILIKLNIAGFLDEELVEKFSVALWSTTDEFNFPVNTDLYKFVFLNLSCSDIDSVSLFRKYILSGGPLHSNNNGNLGVVMLRQELAGARDAVHWSEDECVLLLNKLVGWWDQGKKCLRGTDSSDLFGEIGGDFKAEYQNYISIMVDVIAPSLNNSISKDIKLSLARLFREFSEYGLFCLRAEAACLHIFPKNAEKINCRIGDGINSNLSDSVTDALMAIWSIVKLAGSDKFNPEIENIFMLLGQQIKWRRKVALDVSMDILTTIANDFPHFLSSNLQVDTLIGLDFLLEETSLGFQHEEFTIYDQLSFREQSAKLAFAFNNLFIERGDPLPDVIGKWRDVCASEKEFAEIRNMWKSLTKH